MKLGHIVKYNNVFFKFDKGLYITRFSVVMYLLTATSFFLPHQNLAKSHHLSSGAKDSKPLKYINTDIREQNIYDYD